VWVDSADDAAARVREAGGTVLAEPFDVGDAGRMAVFADPSGAVFCVWQAGTNRGAQYVNGAGAWVFSDLSTPDPQGAEAFYGAVFGWEARSVDFGAGESWMLIRPGYGDHLEEIDPGVRDRHAEGGAPEGFTDAVAWMQPLTDADQPPHWAITFTVDDADAAAARVAELGGTVLAGPFDAGPTRVAVVRDPQGAVFSVSRYYPERS
jgi:predicted enzyme related to lactoylglutathione lyase